MKHKLIVIIALLLYAVNTFSQTGYGESLEKSIFKGVASPTAQDLGKYGEIPMNLYTGRANVSIPLYSISQRNVPLDISLSYDTGGLLINQLPSWTGHGWTLNAGGCITRKLQEYYDEDENMSYAIGTSNVNLVSYFDNVYRITDKTDEELASDHTNESVVYDYSPDIFIFNFMGKSGRFFLGEDKKWHVQCEENIKVEFDINDKSNYILPFIENYSNYPYKMSKTIKGFTLIDENGTKYKFGGTTDAIEYCIGFFKQDVEDWRANSWYLTEVQDRFGNTLYSFCYKRGKFIAQIFNNISVTYRDARYSDMTGLTPEKMIKTILGIGWTERSVHALYAESTYDFPYVLTLNAPVYLTRISTLDDKVIDFHLSDSIAISETSFYPHFEDYCTANTNLPLGQFYRNDASVPYIRQFPHRQDVVYLCYLRNHIGFAKNYPLYWDANARKRIEKEHSNNTSLPWLDKPWNNPLSVLSFTPLQSIEVSCKDENSNKQRVKLIDIVYNKSPRLHITSVNMYGRDGNSTNGDVYSYKMEYKDYDKIPSDYLTLKSDFWGFYNGNENNNEANPITTKYGMMSKLIYPTGGYTEFEYEQNTYSQCQNDIKTGMIVYDSDQYTGGLRIKRIKDYSKENDLQKTRTFSYLSMYDNLSSGQCYSIPRTTNVDFQNSNFSSEYCYYFYKNSSAIPLTDSYNPHIGYSWVTETSANCTRKYKYTNFSDYLDEYPYRVAGKSWYDPRTYSQYNKYTDMGFARGKLLQEMVYDDNKVKYQCDYMYNVLDINKHVASCNFSKISNSIAKLDRYTIGCAYKLYYCNLELQRKIETYDCGINDITEYNMEDWRPNQKDLSFSLRKLKSEKITRLANGKEFDSQEKMYLYLTSEIKDYFFPVTDILTYRNGEQTMCHSVVYDTFSNIPNHKLPAKEIVTQYPHFQKHTKVSYDQYDKTGQLLQFTETGNPTTFLSWDNYGRLIKTANGSPNSYITSYNYTSDGQINKITTPNGNATSYNYDSFGRLNAVTDVNDKTLQKIEYNYRKK